MSGVGSDSSEPHDRYLERKSVDTSGRLGSLYDAFTDNIIDQQTVQASETKPSAEPYTCQFPGDRSNAVIDYLKLMDFNNAMRQSILFGMVTPSGVSCLINYNQSINENTRFLYYSYRSKDEELILTPEKVDQLISHLPSSTHVTHIITKIIWGFEILCVIPIPDHQSADIVDSLLQDISIRLKDNKSDFVLTDDEERQVAQLITVTVYGSKTCIDNPNISLLTVFANLKDWQKHENFHHPLKYMMWSLGRLCNSTQFPEFSDPPDQTNSDIAKIQPTIIWLDNWAKYFNKCFETLPENFPSLTLNQSLKNIKEHFDTWLTTYKELQNHLRQMLVDIRQCRCEARLIQDVISNQQNALLEDTEIHAFNKTIRQLLTKANLINQLNEDQIQYINVMDLFDHKEISMTYEHIEVALLLSLFKEDSCVFILYSNDRLKHEKSAAWEEQYQQLISKRQQAAQITTLVYADFTQCQYDLEQLTIVNLPIQMSETPRNHPPDRPIQSSYSPPLQRPQKRPPSPAKTEINVLMLGETDVSKSTFINAFVNYLMFDTLQQAEQSEPIVLIPVSFLTTVGDVDPNEDHEHQGQSVTQQCKSYVFDLNDRLRLRIIDTPGIGDTRGTAQDDKNIDHILTYVNSLSHLNAVCLLLKPDASQLNVFFRSCVNQLFTCLTPIGSSNIVFCFTNARGTFYAPGDTDLLLRQMLKTEDQDDISFEKTNTFCFDSESFRYLAARKCDVNFDDFQKQECTNSWTTSVNESVRLLNYILTREAFNLNEWQSPRKVALEISILARPLMETLRLTIYNWQLCEAGLTDKEMILNSNPVTAEMCSNCAQNNVVNVASYWIVEYEPVKNDTVQHCQCPFDETHFLIESTVKHHFATQPIDLPHDELRDHFHKVLFQCDRLAYYLRQNGPPNQDDPFRSVLKQFLKEEQQIFDKIKNNVNMNKEVKKILCSIKKTRQQNKQQLMQTNENLSLREINEIIDQLKSLRAVSQQFESIKTSRQVKMEANEYIIKLPPIKNKIFSEFINSLH